MGTPTLIIVSGPAGSGKTTLAHELSAAVGCPALCRDEIKEGMVASNPGFVPAISDPLTVRTYELFFEAIALFLKAEVTLVAEAAFQHTIWWQGLQPLTDLATLKIIRPDCPRRGLVPATPTPSTSPRTGRSTPSMSTPPRSTSTPVTAGIRAST